LNPYEELIYSVLEPQLSARMTLLLMKGLETTVDASKTAMTIDRTEDICFIRYKFDNFD
jgi:hypothetical protein